MYDLIMNNIHIIHYDAYTYDNVFFCVDSRAAIATVFLQIYKSY